MSIGGAAMLRLLCGCCLTVALAFTASGQEVDEQPFPPRRVVANLQNAPWAVVISLNRDDGIYEEGETLELSVRSERPGFVYVINFYGSRPDGHFEKALVLFPNKFQADNKIEAKARLLVPGTDAQFELPAQLPEGAKVSRERIKVIVSEQPLKSVDDLLPSKDDAASFATVEEQHFAPVLKDQKRKNQWAEHFVDVAIVPKDWRREHAHVATRIGLFIGVKDYLSDRINKLRVSDEDARRMHALSKTALKLDASLLLVDKEATHARIEKAFTQDLPQLTKPGDTVVIYWSGHGGRVADASGDEEDGQDEFFVPYDGEISKIDTMVLDDQLARWLAGLNGRTIVLIFDTCHSGGAVGEKGIEVDITPAKAKLDLLDGDLQRFSNLKDPFVEQTALLAACSAEQRAIEPPDFETSLMTHYLLDALSQGRGRLSLQSIYDSVKTNVDKFESHQQSTILLGLPPELPEKFILRLEQ